MWCESHLVVPNPLCPHGLYSPWNSPGQNTGAGNLSLLQGIFPTQGWNSDLPHCRQMFYQLSHKGSPRILEGVAYPFFSGSSRPRNRTGVSCIAGGFFTSWANRETLRKFSLWIINSPFNLCILHPTWYFFAHFLLFVFTWSLPGEGSIPVQFVGLCLDDGCGPRLGTRISLQEGSPGVFRSCCSAAKVRDHITQFWVLYWIHCLFTN